MPFQWLWWFCCRPGFTLLRRDYGENEKEEDESFELRNKEDQMCNMRGTLEVSLTEPVRATNGCERFLQVSEEMRSLIAEKNHAKADEDQDVVVKGWLQREVKGGVRTPWFRLKKYWFVLSQDSLDYYSSNEKNAKQLGSLVLTSLCSVMWPDKQTYKQTGYWNVTVYGRKHCFRLFTEHLNEAVHWVCAIQKVVDSKAPVETPTQLLIRDIGENCSNQEVVEQIYKRNPILQYTKSPLYAPLLPFSYGGVDQPLPSIKGYSALRDEAVKIFNSIQQLETAQDPVPIIQGVLQTGLDLRLLRDEMYCQLIKQTTDVPSPGEQGSLRCWQLLTCMSCTFLPSPPVLRSSASTSVRMAATASEAPQLTQRPVDLSQKDLFEATGEPNSDEVTSLNELKEYLQEISRDLKVVRSDLTTLGSDLRREIRELGGRMKDAENHIEEQAEELNKLDRRFSTTQIEIQQLTEKLEDLENRSRRRNLRFRGLPEVPLYQDCEATIKKLVVALLAEAGVVIPEDEIKLERTHRTLGPLRGNYPKDIIACFENFKLKEQVLKTARTAQNFKWDTYEIAIFQDLASATLKCRAALKPVTMKLREMGIKYRWRYPFALAFYHAGRLHQVKSIEEAREIIPDGTEKTSTSSTSHASRVSSSAGRPPWQRVGKGPKRLQRQKTDDPPASQACFPDTEIDKYSAFISQSLEKTTLRECVPSWEEILVLIDRQEMLCTIHYPGAGSCQIPINSHTTADEVVKMMIDKLGLGLSHNVFALYQQNSQREQAVGKTTIIADIITRFENLSGAGKGCDSPWRLCFKLYCFLDTEEVPKDSVEFTFLYEQAHEMVTRGYLPMSEDTLQSLAALRLQFLNSDFSTHAPFPKLEELFPLHILQARILASSKPLVSSKSCPVRFHAGLLSGALPNGLWNYSLLKQKAVEDQKFKGRMKEEGNSMMSAITDKWKLMQGMDRNEAVVAYLSIVKEWPGFGSTMFDVEFYMSSAGSFSQKLWLGVNARALSLYKQGDVEPFESFSYGQISSFSVSDSNTLKVSAGDKDLLFETTKVDEITQLINTYLTSVGNGQTQHEGDANDCPENPKEAELPAQEV
ncbi:pleckstrin homology domain-containing family H member 3 [Microcaecilia unicolor]|uniref:Pleckstrin homology domain-containing family H member 3 n=1 Tax=Microcaecilia unicolor TaxID=1415580 RepID=A0A6P7ZM27_9AMPH|nr:pleckstrin homology domain-containing family H member 3 [Microcaecilia unicolor]